MPSWSRAKGSEDVVASPSHGQAQANQGDALSSRLSGFTQYPLLPVVCCLSSKQAGHRALLLSSSSITSAETLLRRSSVTSHGCLSLNTSGLSPIDFAFFVFYFFTGLRVGERGSGKNIFLFLLKTFPDPLAVRNGLGLPFNGGVEGEESEISAIKRP